MRLTGNQLFSIVHNALSVEADEKGHLHFRRFTEAAEKNYGIDGETFPSRCRASSNVTLDFLTDSEWFGFDYELFAATSQLFSGFDVFVDGTMVMSQFRDGLKSQALTCALPGGNLHRVTVFLPWSVETVIKTVSVADGAKVLPVPEKRTRILAIGDSITQGYIARHPAYTWVGKVTRALDAEVLNQGVGGYCFYENSLTEPIPYAPNLILLAYGTNDYSGVETAAAYEARLRGYMKRLAELFPGVPVLQLLPIWRNDLSFHYKEKARDYTLEDARNIIRRVAAEYPNITVADVNMPQDQDFFAPDWVHPNDLGFQIFGERVIEQIREMKLCGIARV